MAHVISLEARAKHNMFMNQSNYGDQTGLSCFAPVINILRHPLWGRNQVEMYDVLLIYNFELLNDVLKVHLNKITSI